MSGASELLEEAGIALEAGDVESAVARLADAVELDDPPLAHVMLGGIAYMDDRFPEAREEWSAPSPGYAAPASNARRRASRPTSRNCMRTLLVTPRRATGGRTAPAGCSSKSGRVRNGGTSSSAFMACDRPDVDELLDSAERALAIAAAFHDVALEVRALADSGLALVTQGRLHEGFDRLDAALAAIAAGEVRDVSVVGKSFCSMLSSCDRVGDVRRAEEWTNLVQAMLLDRFEGRPRVLHTHCLAAYGSVLCRAGRWPEAESALTAVLGPTGSSSFGHRADTAATLALLRVEQGRLDEAAALLEPYEDRVTACVPMARLHLRRNEPEAAAAVLRRGLGELVGDALRGATLLSLLVEAELAHGDVDAASSAAERLAVIAAHAESPVLAAEADIARGRVDAAAGDCDAAVAAFEAAQRHVADGERPLLAGQARLALAEVFAANGDESNAVAAARAALATFERLGATSSRDRARALLRTLGVGVRLRDRSGPAPRVVDAARIRSAGLGPPGSAATPTSAAQLYISPKTAEHHVGRILTQAGRPQPGRGRGPRGDEHAARNRGPL